MKIYEKEGSNVKFNWRILFFVFIILLNLSLILFLDKEIIIWFIYFQLVFYSFFYYIVLGGIKEWT